MDVDKTPLEPEEVQAVTVCPASGCGYDVCGRESEDEGASMPGLERLVLGCRWRQPCAQTVEHGAFSV